MGFGALFYPWGVVLQAMAILHFVKRRPEGFWLWVILLGGGLGALVYFIAEVLPDVQLLRASMAGQSRRRRIRELEARCTAADAREQVLSHGGTPVGEVVTVTLAARARVTWCYVRDPEGNIIELQSWEQSG